MGFAVPLELVSQTFSLVDHVENFKNKIYSKIFYSFHFYKCMQ